jgi:signal peptidase II
MEGSSRIARASWLAFFGLAAAIVVADQLLKGWIVPRFEVGVPVPMIGDLVRIWLIHNTGALFGLFRDQAVLFAAGSIGVIALIIWFHPRAVASHGALATVALGLLLGGAIGNLIDRVSLGYVIDFVDLGIGDWRFYTFNVADAAISTSLVLLVVMAFLPARRPADATA